MWSCRRRWGRSRQPPRLAVHRATRRTKLASNRSRRKRRQATASRSGPSLAEIDLGHARIDRGPGRLAVEDFLAVVEHDYAIDDAHQHAHDVFDPDDGHAHPGADGFEETRGVLHLGRIETAKTFVGKKEPWLGGERAGEFELF